MYIHTHIQYIHVCVYVEQRCRCIYVCIYIKTGPLQTGLYCIILHPPLKKSDFHPEQRLCDYDGNEQSCKILSQKLLNHSLH